ncbi:MAG: ATP-binding protein [Lachnospiraceae bacterium]|nr:ATP-binding protein [Lachnospiraceae bacterium]
MALTNAQYESILREYEDRQDRNRRLLSQRKTYVYEHVDGYRELEDAVSTVSVRQGRKMLSGEDGAMEQLRTTLARLALEKQNLLRSAGLPEDYLEPVYDCQDCQDTGYIDGEKCHCLKQRILNLLYEQSNLEKLFTSKGFSSLSDTYYEGEDLTRFRNAVKSCEEFIQNFKTDYRNLFFYGTVGTGKSLLSYCTARELLRQGYSVIYFSSTGLFDMLARYSFDTKAKESLYSTYDDLYNCDLVIIDDLGTEVTNSFVTSQLFACLNERHMRRKSTIISTNLTLEELRDRYSDRIFSRITSYYKLCKLSGPDIRMYQKRMENRK